MLNQYLSKICTVLIDNGFTMLGFTWFSRDLRTKDGYYVGLTILTHPDRFPYTLVVQYMEGVSKIAFGIVVEEDTFYDNVAQKILDSCRETVK
jgi:hypothetical protein